MNSYRNVFWRGAFALALLPVSACLVAANGTEVPGANATWQYDFAAASQVQELRAAAAEARAERQQAFAIHFATIRIERAQAPKPKG